jgi:hypothetical protein
VVWCGASETPILICAVIGRLSVRDLIAISFVGRRRRLFWFVLSMDGGLCEI